MENKDAPRIFTLEEINKEFDMDFTSMDDVKQMLEDEFTDHDFYPMDELGWTTEQQEQGIEILKQISPSTQYEIDEDLGLIVRVKTSEDYLATFSLSALV